MLETLAMTLREYQELLGSPPAVLTTTQKRTDIALAILIGCSRLLSLSQTLWDWDEAQFCSAVRSYDVSLHHPHPPGYPLFIAAAKTVRFFINSDFRSLQVVVFVAALLLFPLFLTLLRELRFATGTAIGAAALLCFVPTVWYHGGTAFSDVPALTLVLAASAMLLRSCRRTRFFLAGTALLGIALGFRPQALMVGILPFVLAASFAGRRSPRSVLTAATLLAAIAIVSYRGAAVATGSVREFVHAVHDTSVWVRSVDSYHNVARPPLGRLFVHVFIAPIGGGRQRNVIFALSLVSVLMSIAGRRVEVWFLGAMFVPAALLTWLMLDVNAATRYAIAYVPLYAALCVDALARLASPLSRFDSRIPAASMAFVTTVLIARSMWWTLPALRIAKTTASPPVSGMLWIREHVRPVGVPLYVHGSLDPFADYFLPDYRIRRVSSSREVPAAFGSAGFLAQEGGSNSPQAITFTRDHGRIWNIARQRCFEVSVVPLAQSVYFLEGWYDQESSGRASWRWMGRRSRLLLAPVRGTTGLLRLRLSEPDAIVPFKPIVRIIVNGTALAQVRSATGRIEGRWIVPSRSAGPGEVVLEVDRVINARRQHLGDDDRDLGLKLDEVSWTAGTPPDR